MRPNSAHNALAGEYGFVAADAVAGLFIVCFGVALALSAQALALRFDREAEFLRLGAETAKIQLAMGPTKLARAEGRQPNLSWSKTMKIVESSDRLPISLCDISILVSKIGQPKLRLATTKFCPTASPS